jgi:glycosyltransferase involved in cell wall biosynthesis
VTDSPAVSVVVPAHNAESTIAGTLAALAAQDIGEPYEVVVVDDASTDGTAAAASAAEGSVTLIPGPGEGAAAARNAGARHARAPVLAFTDSDCYPTPGWLREGLERIRAGADLVQGLVRAAPSELEGPFVRRFWVTRDLGLHETANMFVKRSAFQSVDGFEPLVDHGGGRPMGEDTWFGWRLRRRGAAYEFAPDVVVEHEVFDRGGREFVRERLRDGHFAAIAAAVPELRRTLFYRRVFLSRRSAAFDAALLGLAAATVRRSPLPLLACVPYALQLRAAVEGWGRAGPRFAAIHAVGDALGLISRLHGSIRSRTPVL